MRARIIQAACLFVLLSMQASGAEPDRAPTKFEDLEQLMKAGLHEHFTQLSFTIWHDQPIDKAKMDGVLEAALALQQEAVLIASFDRGVTSRSPEERQSFDRMAARLVRAATGVVKSARDQDETSLAGEFLHLEAACEACHARFRPELVGSAR
jgi:cytochrome c556